MPKVKIAKKSTKTDFTPFVDVAFLILTFFIMATKFKPTEPVPIETPNSVAAQKLPDNNAVMISIDKDNKVYFSTFSKKDALKAGEIAKVAAELKGFKLTDAQVANVKDQALMGMPFGKLGSFLDIPLQDQSKYKQEGIPVTDSLNNELVQWVQAAKNVFAGESLTIMIKGDGASKYPSFKAVVDALKRNDELKYNLVTMPESAPAGSDLEKERLSAPEQKK